MCRLLQLTILTVLSLFSMGGHFHLSGQSRSILGLPDRIMSSSRIGKASQRPSLILPPPDTVRMTFPLGGARNVSEDIDFFNYLLDNELRQDAITLVQMPYKDSDTLDFIRAKVLFSDRKLSQAADLFSLVPLESRFGAESFSYRVVSLATLGRLDEASSLLSSGNIPAAFSGSGPYAELAALQRAGLAIMQGKEGEWRSDSALFSYRDYTLAEAERIVSEIGAGRFDAKRKHAGVAALASAVVPGAGKVYSGRLGEGVAAFLTVGSLGAITAENWKKHGGKDWRTIAAGSLCAAFYLGNIYGSYMSVSIERDERVASENALILYHLHLPLRSIFR